MDMLARPVQVALATLIIAAAGCASPSTPESIPSEPGDENPTTAPAQTQSPTQTGTQTAPPEPPSRNETGQIQHDGLSRTYHVHLPPGNGPFPLLVALHGGAGSAEQFQASAGIDPHAEAAGIAVLYPDGWAPPRQPTLQTWGAVHCCNPAWGFGIDDIGFLDALLRHVRSEHPIADGPVGLAGHSNGAMMALHYGAARSQDVASVLSVAGTIGGQRDADSPELRIGEPDGPVSVAFMHAIDDENVPYEGGHGVAAAEPSRIDLSVAEGVAFWRAANKADEATQWTQDGVSYVRYDGDAPVWQITTQGGHGWPGSGSLVPGPAAPDAGAFAVNLFVAALGGQTSSQGSSNSDT